ncbi:hypothetical protein RUM43_013561 [Polyplax serrata]|uniref:Uncharacterized protein n=1 Tax=Polyplax serrata TaxID=468196 RepID=A0AAN8RYN6_POLSC
MFLWTLLLLVAFAPFGSSTKKQNDITRDLDTTYTHAETIVNEFVRSLIKDPSGKVLRRRSAEPEPDVEYSISELQTSVGDLQSLSSEPQSSDGDLGPANGDLQRPDVDSDDSDVEPDPTKCDPNVMAATTPDPDVEKPSNKTLVKKKFTLGAIIRAIIAAVELVVAAISLINILSTQVLQSLTVSEIVRKFKIKMFLWTLLLLAAVLPFGLPEKELTKGQQKIIDDLDANYKDAGSKIVKEFMRSLTKDQSPEKKVRKGSKTESDEPEPEENDAQMSESDLQSTNSDPEPSENNDKKKQHTPAAPAKPAPAENKPAESKPAESKPAESKPAESKPAERNPAERKSAEPNSNKNKDIVGKFPFLNLFSGFDGFFSLIDNMINLRKDHRECCQPKFG